MAKWGKYGKNVCLSGWLVQMINLVVSDLVKICNILIFLSNLDQDGLYHPFLVNGKNNNGI